MNCKEKCTNCKLKLEEMLKCQILIKKLKKVNYIFSGEPNFRNILSTEIIDGKETIVPPKLMWEKCACAGISIDININGTICLKNVIRDMEREIINI